MAGQQGPSNDDKLVLPETEFQALVSKIWEILRQPSLQKGLTSCRPLPELCGEWLVAFAEDGDIERAGSLRLLRSQDSSGDDQGKRARNDTLTFAFRYLVVQSGSADIVGVILRNSAQYFRPIEAQCFWAHFELFLFQGPFERVPLELLEVAWALRCFPRQVSLLAERGEDGLKNLQALRKRVHQILETSRPSANAQAANAGTRDEGGPEAVRDGETTAHQEADSQGERVCNPFEQDVMARLQERSEEALLDIGNRVIELLCLQDVVKSAAPRLWRQSEARQAAHRGLILTGAFGPELLRQELKANTTATLPPGVARNGLNGCFLSLGLDKLLLSDEASLVLRAKATEYSGKACALQHGLNPILVTAPHNIVLVRDGKPPHRMEESTTFIAERIATHLGGTSLTWNRRQQFRTELRWAVAKGHGTCELPGNDCGLLDPSNRDPNFLSTEEIPDNEWFQQMKRAKEKWKTRGVGPHMRLHLDVHGCRDPPCHAAHLIMGLGAMRSQAQTPQQIQRVQTFASNLLPGVSSVIADLQLRPAGEPVRIVVPTDLDNPPSLCGAWPRNLGRHTQTQQAVEFANFSHACQLEMSLSLRRALAASREATGRLADEIWKAYTKHVMSGVSESG